MRSLEARRVVVSVGLALSLGACRGARVKNEGSPYSVGEVMSRFKEMTGDELRVQGKVLDLRHAGGVTSVALSVPNGLRRKYGDFSYVVVWGKPTTLMGRLLDPVLPDKTKPRDADGVHWAEGYNELSANPRPYWAADKSRGNVKLIWFPPSRKRGSTEVFRKLEAVLASLRTQS
jgi:hypothetical protein